ncbi:MAG: histidine decarboxylase [Candidatus Magasanikbacteria bacterium]
MTPEEINERLSKFEEEIHAKSILHMGFPCNFDFDYSPIFPLFKYNLNNLGDPFDECNYQMHAREFEREALYWLADVYKLPREEFWGYTASCGTEGNMHGLFVARELYPKARLYFSEDAHYSLKKSAHILQLDYSIVPSCENGEMNVSKFEKILQQHGKRPAVVVINIGTTVKGAIDNLDEILEVLKRNGIEEHYIHCDGALSGLILPFISEPDAPVINFSKSIDSVAISGHKFIGSPIPYGIVLARKKNIDKISHEIEYIGSHDSTISGSRGGHTALISWYAFMSRGVEGFKKDVYDCLARAQYLYESLVAIHYPKCFLNKWSTTVVFERPSEALIHRHQLAVQGDLAHVVVMQQISKERIDEFVEELKEEIKTKVGGEM